jgi:cytoskeletal protein RodZ
MAAIASSADPSISSVPEPPAVGPVLRAARQTQGMSITEAAQATNIRQSYLQALEDDEPLEAYPAPVYERFFLREYARFLGVDEEPLVRAMDARLETVEPALDIPPPAVPPPRRWVGQVLAALAALGVAALAIASLWPRHSTPSASTTRPPSVAAPAPTPSAQPSSGRQTKPKGMSAVLTFSARCWVRVTADGTVKVERTYVAGDSLRVRARRSLTLRLGNAGGVELRINGKHYATSGSVVTLSYEWRDGHVIPPG